MWHIDEIRNSLTKKGWRILSEELQDDDRYTCFWEIALNSKQVTLAFEGYDEFDTFDFSQSFGCHVLEDQSVAIHLPKKSPTAKKITPIRYGVTTQSNFFST